MLCDSLFFTYLIHDESFGSAIYWLLLLDDNASVLLLMMVLYQGIKTGGSSSGGVFRDLSSSSWLGPLFALLLLHVDICYNHKAACHRPTLARRALRLSQGQVSSLFVQGLDGYKQ